MGPQQHLSILEQSSGVRPVPHTGVIVWGSEAQIEDRGHRGGAAWGSRVLALLSVPSVSRPRPC